MTMINPYNYSKPKRPVGMQPKKSNSLSSATAKKANYAKADNYLEQKVMSAKPEELTLMLYEGAVKFIKQAKIFNDQGNKSKSHELNLRAQAIIEELRATLNLEIEVSKNFESLYVYINERLVEANISKDNKILDEALELIIEFRDTWKKAMNL